MHVKENKMKDKILELAIEFCLICPNCDRKMPNLAWRRKHGCFWCVPKESTKYCDGKYI